MAAVCRVNLSWFGDSTALIRRCGATLPVASAKKWQFLEANEKYIKIQLWTEALKMGSLLSLFHWWQNSACLVFEKGHTFAKKHMSSFLMSISCDLHRLFSISKKTYPFRIFLPVLLNRWASGFFVSPWSWRLRVDLSWRVHGAPPPDQLGILKQTHFETKSDMGFGLIFGVKVHTWKLWNLWVFQKAPVHVRPPRAHHNWRALWCWCLSQWPCVASVFHRLLMKHSGKQQPQHNHSSLFLVLLNNFLAVKP